MLGGAVVLILGSRVKGFRVKDLGILYGWQSKGLRYVFYDACRVVIHR